MKGRSKAGRERPKAMRRKAPASTRNKGPKVARQRSSSAVEEPEIARLRQELKEAHERDAAAAEVLRVISSSPGALEPVFKRMLDNAVRLCEAKFGNIYLVEHGTIRLVASHNIPPAFVEFRKHTRPSTDPNTPSGRLLRTKAVVHIPDLAAEESYREGHPGVVAAVELLGERTSLHVPMLKDGELVGYLSIYRQEVRPFTDSQIALVENFATQAVIAIENARVLNELRESLQQQTATSEVLKVISRSTFDLQTVLDTLIKSAAELCEADIADIHRQAGSEYRQLATFGQSPYDKQFISNLPFVPARGVSVVGRTLLEAKPVHVLDVLADPEFTPQYQEFAKRTSRRTALGVPLLRDGKVIGVMFIARRTVRPFTDKQIALATTFADQAMIAIENVRLLESLQARTNEASEALEQQTATSEILKVISNSLTDTQPVFEAIVRSALKLFPDAAIAIALPDGDQVRAAAIAERHNEHAKFWKGTFPNPLSREYMHGTAILDFRIVDVPDAEAHAATGGPFAVGLKVFLTSRYRAITIMPMLRGDAAIGAISVARPAPGPLSTKQMELLRTFADQAVIAIENVRLFDEIQDKSRQIESESRHKSQFLANMSHELRTPLNAILGYTELVIDSIYGEVPAKMRGVLERVQSNGRHLLGLINDVLDLSKIEAGQLTLTLADYSIADVVQTVISAVEPLASGKHLALKSELAPNLPRVRGDERRIAQVLLNLVGNAVKFTDSGEVALRASAANGSVTVAVRDTGPGISESDQGRIFEEFQQADTSITRGKGGTGLGLAISKRIIEMHGGKIWVESQVGQGSTFFVTVPVRVEQQVGQ